MHLYTLPFSFVPSKSQKKDNVDVLKLFSNLTGAGDSEWIPWSRPMVQMVWASDKYNCGYWGISEGNRFLNGLVSCFPKMLRIVKYGKCFFFIKLSSSSFFFLMVSYCCQSMQVSRSHLLWWLPSIHERSCRIASSQLHSWRDCKGEWLTGLHWPQCSNSILCLWQRLLWGRDRG